MANHPSLLVQSLALAKMHLEDNKRSPSLSHMLLNEIISLEKEEGLEYNWKRPYESNTDLEEHSLDLLRTPESIFSQLRIDLLSLLDYVQDDREEEDFRNWLLGDGNQYISSMEEEILSQGSRDEIQNLLEYIAERDYSVPHIWAAAHRLRQAFAALGI